CYLYIHDSAGVCIPCSARPATIMCRARPRRRWINDTVRRRFRRKPTGATRAHTGRWVYGNSAEPNCRIPSCFTRAHPGGGFATVRSNQTVVNPPPTPLGGYGVV